MYVVVRRYEGATDAKEVAKKVNEGLVPLIKTAPSPRTVWEALGSG
jgi:hypothetical protein